MSTEWYTPHYVIEPIRKVFDGEITMDPCSNVKAQKNVKARYWCGLPASEGWIARDGLILPWCGNVFVNPPYSRGQIIKWADKLANELCRDNIEQFAFLTRCDPTTEWWRILYNFSRVVVLIDHRVQFLTPEGVKGKTPNFASALFFGGEKKTLIVKVLNHCRPLGYILPTRDVFNLSVSKS